MTQKLRATFMNDPVGKLMMMIIGALVVWFGATVQQSEVTIAMLDERVHGVQAEIRSLANERSRAEQTRSDLAVIAQRLDALEGGNSELRGRVRALESGRNQAR